MTDETHGTSTMTAEPKRITVRFPDGTTAEKQVRRLSTRDVFKLLKILSIGSTMGVGGIQDMDTMDDLTVTRMATLFGAGLINAEEYALDFLAGLINMPVKTQHETDKGTGEETVVRYGFEDLDAEALIEIIEAILEGDDVVSFFGKCKAMAKSGAFASFMKRMGHKPEENGASKTSGSDSST